MSPHAFLNLFCQDEAHGKLTTIITCDKGGNLYRELETLCVFSIIGPLLGQYCIRSLSLTCGKNIGEGAHFNWL